MTYEILLADRTRLELATPCVTGMYSNQTELPIRSLFDGAKIHFFSIARHQTEYFFLFVIITLLTIVYIFFFLAFESPWKSN